MPRRTPPLNTVGRYELNTPWLAQTTKVYTCKAIRTFDDLRARSIDPFKFAYQPYGATDSVYQSDLTERAAIVTLMSADGEIIYVPDTQIVSYPNMGDYHYRHLVLSVSLGAVPDSLSLEWLMEQISETTRLTVGITPAVNLHEALVRDAIDPVEHEQIQAARAAAITNTVTYKAQVETLTRVVNEQAARLAAYEQKMRDEGLL
jgi:hypothetical protein